MPELKDALDVNRYDAIRDFTILGANLWLSLNLAASRRDADACRQLWDKIRRVSVDVSDLLKALNTERDDG